MAISFDSYKIFYYVAQYQNITSAAHALFLTQPTVSHSILNLEKELGCQLFVRSKKGVTLTPEAEILYHHISKACRHIFEGEEALNRQLSMAEGLVRIGASETTLHHYLLPYLEQFKTIHPQIRLKISNTTTPTAIAALKDGMIDLAVVVSAGSEKGLIMEHVSEFQDVFIAGAHYEHLKGQKLCIRDLTAYPLVCMERGTGTRDYMESIFLNSHCELVPDIELATTDLLTPIVAHNLGIGFVPVPFAEAALKDGTVFRLDVTDFNSKRSVCIVNNAGKPLSVAAEALVKLLVRESVMNQGKQEPSI